MRDTEVAKQWLVEAGGCGDKRAARRSRHGEMNRSASGGALEFGTRSSSPASVAAAETHGVGVGVTRTPRASRRRPSGGWGRAQRRTAARGCQGASATAARVSAHAQRRRHCRLARRPGPAARAHCPGAAAICASLVPGSSPCKAPCTIHEAAACSTNPSMPPPPPLPNVAHACARAWTAGCHRPGACSGASPGAAAAAALTHGAGARVIPHHARPRDRPSTLIYP